MVQSDTEFEVLIVGGGIAGYSAALVLARSLVRCAIIDEESTSGNIKKKVYNFLTNDGLLKSDIISKSIVDVTKYQNATPIKGRATSIEKTNNNYYLYLEDGRKLSAPKVVFSTGNSLRPDKINILGAEDIFGTSLFTCPYCHGYEYTDKNITLLSTGPHDLNFSALLSTWSKNINFLTNGDPISNEFREKFYTFSDGKIIQDEISAIAHDSGLINEIKFTSGTSHKTDVIFMSDVPSTDGNDLIDQLNIARITCPQTNKIVYETDPTGRTRLGNVFIIGDARTGFSTMIGAAHEGLIAGVLIINDLVNDQL